MAILSRAGTLIKTTTTTTITDSCPFFKTISTFTFLSQEPQLAKATHSQLASASTPLPPNIASESPLYNENWRNPIPNSFQTKVSPSIPELSLPGPFTNPLCPWLDERLC